MSSPHEQLNKTTQTNEQKKTYVLCLFVFRPQLVLQAVILIRRETYVGGQQKLKTLTALALNSGEGRQTLKAVDLRMITPNLDVNGSFTQMSL